jgi:maltooligosyltrehalose trehalohydrolase
VRDAELSRSIEYGRRLPEPAARSYEASRPTSDEERRNAIRERERLGATVNGDGSAAFLVWSPSARSVGVVSGDGEHGAISLTGPDEFGYYRGGVGRDGNIAPGTLYRYRLDGDPARTFPDPASRWQPDGVDGPSAALDPCSFRWTDQGWTGLDLGDLVLYELHVGTFSREGTFEGAAKYLDGLRDLGVTMIEPMPIGQFPGSRNWGYDGVFPFAVQNTYGGPEGFARFVDACHSRGLGVCLDVVYNHVGPQGSVLHQFGPYFTDRYRTPWGDAVNLDGPGSDEVRRFFTENAVQWFDDFHVDALRLDAVHGIFDMSASPFLKELELAKERSADRLGRKLHLVAESDLGDPKIVRRREVDGHGLDAHWSDDIHHAVHALVTGERSGYYEDFGSLEQLVRGYRDGWVYQGEYSRHRRRGHGAPVTDIPAERFVVFSQNHDQVGNRLFGERLTQLVDFESLKLAASSILLSPFLPLLFMGEEYGEPAPFQYFISHSHPGLVEAVRKGRAKEFASFGFTEEGPDPQAEETFERSMLHRELSDRGDHRLLLDLYREMLRLRRALPPLANLSKETAAVWTSLSPKREKVVVLHRWIGRDHVAMFLNFAEEDGEGWTPAVEGTWKRLLDTSDERWGGPGIDPDGPAKLVREERQPSSIPVSMRRRSAVLLRAREEHGDGA